jgi:hypothetical protein
LIEGKELGRQKELSLKPVLYLVLHLKAFALKIFHRSIAKRRIARRMLFCPLIFCVLTTPISLKSIQAMAQDPNPKNNALQNEAKKSFGKTWDHQSSDPAENSKRFELRIAGNKDMDLRILGVTQIRFNPTSKDQPIPSEDLIRMNALLRYIRSKHTDQFSIEIAANHTDLEKIDRHSDVIRKALSSEDRMNTKLIYQGLERSQALDSSRGSNYSNLKKAFSTTREDWIFATILGGAGASAEAYGILARSSDFALALGASIYRFIPNFGFTLFRYGWHSFIRKGESFLAKWFRNPKAHYYANITQQTFKNMGAAFILNAIGFQLGFYNPKGNAVLTPLMGSAIQSITDLMGIFVINAEGEELITRKTASRINVIKGALAIGISILAMQDVPMAKEAGILMSIAGATMVAFNPSRVWRFFKGGRTAIDHRGNLSYIDIERALRGVPVVKSPQNESDANKANKRLNTRDFKTQLAGYQLIKNNQHGGFELKFHDFVLESHLEDIVLIEAEKDGRTVGQEIQNKDKKLEALRLAAKQLAAKQSKTRPIYLEPWQVLGQKRARGLQIEVPENGNQKKWILYFNVSRVAEITPNMEPSNDKIGQQRSSLRTPNELDTYLLDGLHKGPELPLKALSISKTGRIELLIQGLTVPASRESPSYYLTSEGKPIELNKSLKKWVEGIIALNRGRFYSFVDPHLDSFKARHIDPIYQPLKEKVLKKVLNPAAQKAREMAEGIQSARAVTKNFFYPRPIQSRCAKAFLGK